MESLLSAGNAEEIISRLNRLQANTQPQWGKMTVSQMMAHAQEPLKVATGKLKLKQSLIGVLFGKMAKKQLLKPEPFKKNLPTAPEFKVKDERAFDTEKQHLIDLINDYVKNGPKGITSDAHPFFGKMTIEEWDALQWKHLDHHLRQFGV